MNARILRKWSIHTKNLMSCSVCSLVVVVLLLLVTCAPSLILATMNFRSDASFAASPLHMPTNVIKEASSSSTTTATATAKASTSTLLSTILSPSASLLPSSSLPSSLPNRHHRLASASAVVEVVKTPDTDREPFPGYYKNSYADDTHQMPQVPNGYPSTSIRSRHSDGGSDIGIGIGSRGLMSFTSSSSTSSSSSSSSSSSRSSSSISKHRFNDNTQQQHQQLQPLHSSGNSNSNSHNDNLGYTLQLRGWPRHRMPSYNDEKSIKQHITTNENENENIKDASDNDEDAADQNILYIKNGNNPPQQLSHTADTQRNNFPMHSQSYYNHRRMTERSSQLQRITAKPSISHIAAVPTTLVALAHKHMQPELIHHSKNINNVNNETKYIFPITTTTTTLLQQHQPQQHNNTVSREKNHHLHHFNNNNVNVNKIKSSDLPLRFVIESYEVPASLPLARELTQQQRRMLIHEQHLRQLRTMQQQAARSRRDSLRGRYKNELRTTATSSSASLQSASSSLTSSSSASLLSYRKFPATHHNSNSNSNSHSNLRQQYQQQHQHHHQHQQRIRMRKHSRRYCSARDPAQLAFEAPTVFEGKIVSMTPDRRQNFSATVEVREVFKQQIGYRLQKYLRLQFAYRNNSGECDIYREQLRSRGLVRGDTIEPGRMYLLFVQQIDIGNFTILGQPIRKTKRVVEAVRYAVSGNYAQLASIKSISASNRTVENGQELRIVCRVTGRPPPKVTWFKDHRSINRNRKLYQFSHYKKRSELIIRSFNTSDAGRYECRAKNKVNRNIERRAIVIKAYPVQRFDPNPRGTGNSCPDDASEFCFNGGTCKFFSEIGSYSCICPEGFIGERCDRKEVNNMPPSTYSNEHECGENKYLGSYYC